MLQIGFLPLLTLVFVAAKLFGAIAWSWWWVLAPMWVGIPVVILFVVAMAILAAVVSK